MIAVLFYLYVFAKGAALHVILNRRVVVVRE